LLIQLFTTRCYTCKTPIVDERFFTINDPSLGTPRYYHELHFFCSECGDPFLDPHRSSSAGTEKLRHGRQASAGDGDDDVEAMTANINLWRGHPYCDGCHVRLHAPKCKGCRKPIAGEMLEALGGKWHAECLKCEVRQESLCDRSAVIEPPD
jgi:paxillin